MPDGTKLLIRNLCKEAIIKAHMEFAARSLRAEISAIDDQTLQIKIYGEHPIPEYLSVKIIRHN